MLHACIAIWIYVSMASHLSLTLCWAAMNLMSRVWNPGHLNNWALFWGIAQVVSERNMPLVKNMPYTHFFYLMPSLCTHLKRSHPIGDDPSLSVLRRPIWTVQCWIKSRDCENACTYIQGFNLWWNIDIHDDIVKCRRNQCLWQNYVNHDVSSYCFFFFC